MDVPAAGDWKSMFFAVCAAILTALWALLLKPAAPQTALAAVLIAASGFVLFLFPLIPKGDIDWPAAFVMGLIFFLYQVALYLGVRANGAEMQAVVNLNVIIIVVHTVATRESPLTSDDLAVGAACVLYSLLAFFISYYSPKLD